MLGPKPTGYGFWFDLSLALGFATIARMAIMFLFTVVISLKISRRWRIYG